VAAVIVDLVPLQPIDKWELKTNKGNEHRHVTESRALLVLLNRKITTHWRTRRDYASEVMVSSGTREEHLTVK
jgi:hypothetical protein